jgi:SAM-dependent methyltransferase
MSIRVLDAGERSVWTHSSSVMDLYSARARGEAVEMTCAAQAAELLGGLASARESILDVGCGTGWFARSLDTRGLRLNYWGIDRTKQFVEVARAELQKIGVSGSQILHGQIQYAEGAVNHVVCMNVLTNIDNWHQPLDAMAKLADSTIILRESFGDLSTYSLVVDRFLDNEVPLKQYVNTYSRDEVTAFLQERGFDCRFIVDERTGGRSEDVIGYPHHWEFLLAQRRTVVGP